MKPANIWIIDFFNWQMLQSPPSTNTHLFNLLNSELAAFFLSRREKKNQQQFCIVGESTIQWFHEKLEYVEGSEF